MLIESGRSLTKGEMLLKNLLMQSFKYFQIYTYIHNYNIINANDTCEGDEPASNWPHYIIRMFYKRPLPFSFSPLTFVE